MLLQLTTWECAGQDPSQLFSQCHSTTYRAVRTKNVLGTECYISLGNEIVTFLGVTVLAGNDDGPDFQLSPVNYYNPATLCQVFDKELPRKLQDGLTEAWHKTVPVYFGFLISHENPVEG